MNKNYNNQKFNTGNSHKKNLERLLSERDAIFNRDTDDNNEFTGEITGDVMKIDSSERGLPMRSQYTFKKELADDNNFDFELFKNRPVKSNVKYYDPSMNSNIDVIGADIMTSMTKLSSQIDPASICSDNIGNLNNDIFHYLFKFMNNNIYTVNGIGLYNMFASLYLSSDNISEIELKKFFNFPKKETLHNGLNAINNNLYKISKMMNMQNFMLIGNDVPYDSEYYNNIKKFCTLIRIDISKPTQEANKINMLINKINGEELRHVVNADNIDNLQMMFIMTSIIKPIWMYKFDDIKVAIFNGTVDDRKEYFLHSVNKTFGYYEDNSFQLLEIKCAGEDLYMGILLHKDGLIIDINNTKLNFFITNMKELKLDEVFIPTFKQELKLRYNSCLKNMGLHSVFTKITSKSLFPEGIVLQDIVQNVKIYIENNGNSLSDTCEIKKYKSNRSFIANTPFIYYFRLVKTNTIIMIGSYQ